MALVIVSVPHHTEKGDKMFSKQLSVGGSVMAWAGFPKLL